MSRSADLSSFRKPVPDWVRPWATAASPSVVKLRYRDRYATGFLTSRAALEAGELGHTPPRPVSTPATHVICAAHSVHAAQRSPIDLLTEDGSRRRVEAGTFCVLPLSDIAVAPLPMSLACDHLPLAMGGSFLGSPIVNLGFGGSRGASSRRSAAVGYGRLAAYGRWARSFDGRIALRHPMFVWLSRGATMLPGDSGGPLIVRQQILGVQSMLFSVPGFRWSIADSLLPQRNVLREILRTTGPVE
ncbi:trypsin-like peptidase domain-containing protein [Corynebacterium choanae]|uniref:Trypsin n=1 Tax=Corynebacterium choanae TaxID=1862358 RepID=A0A3G6J670_9CORY|nr:trypsin-like peptidase domain-containing protein [Corynebacterium choanae]AZA13557.1 hypothetical protein CCHOA_05785 [Corynebacterium choanae]